VAGPDTIDCVAPADRWDATWREGCAAKRAKAAWLRSGGAAVPVASTAAGTASAGAASD
jgi:hypothetical protein